MMLDRFICFSWDVYYPCGGSSDEVGRASTFKEAVSVLLRNGLGGGNQILDRETGLWHHPSDDDPDD